MDTILEELYDPCRDCHVETLKEELAEHGGRCRFCDRELGGGA